MIKQTDSVVLRGGYWTVWEIEREEMCRKNKIKCVRNISRQQVKPVYCVWGIKLQCALCSYRMIGLSAPAKLFTLTCLSSSFCNRRFSLCVCVQNFVYAITLCGTRYLPVRPIPMWIHKLIPNSKNVCPAKHLIIRITSHCSKQWSTWTWTVDFKKHEAHTYIA